MALLPAATAAAAAAAASAARAEDDFIAMETREASPTDFLFKIKSCSLLENCGIDKYVTNEFVAGEYKWNLVIHPNGEEKGKDGDYISIYLAMADTSSMPANWEVNAVFSIFLYNEIYSNYLYSLGITRRFLETKSQWGFSKFISKKILTDPSNGYLVNGDCMFGVEIFVVKSKKEPVTTEYLSLRNFEIPYKRDWKIPNFSKLVNVWKSEQFSVGGHKWFIELYPKGHGEEYGRHVTIFLNYSGPNTCTPFERVQACSTMTIKDQVHEEVYHRKTGTAWFSDSQKKMGWPAFIEIETINDPIKGFILNTFCLLSIEISVKALVQVSPLPIKKWSFFGLPEEPPILF